MELESNPVDVSRLNAMTPQGKQKNGRKTVPGRKNNGRKTVDEKDGGRCTGTTSVSESCNTKGCTGTRTLSFRKNLV